MKRRRWLPLIVLLLVNCAVGTSKPKDEAQAFVEIQRQTPASFEASGEWSALGSIRDTIAAKFVKGDTLMSGSFRFLYQRGEYRFEMYRSGGTPLAFAINHADTFLLSSYPDDLTIITDPQGTIAFLGAGMQPRLFPLIFLMFPTTTPADSFFYSGGNVVYTVKDDQWTVNPATQQVLGFISNNVEVSYRDFRAVGRLGRPARISVQGGIPFRVVNQVEFRVTTETVNPKLRPELFSAKPAPTKRFLNFMPKEQNRSQ